MNLPLSVWLTHGTLQTWDSSRASDTRFISSIMLYKDVMAFYWARDMWRWLPGPLLSSNIRSRSILSFSTRDSFYTVCWIRWLISRSFHPLSSSFLVAYLALSFETAAALPRLHSLSQLIFSRDIHFLGVMESVNQPRELETALVGLLYDLSQVLLTLCKLLH